ncbi:hypothetical protein SK128_002628 [Halocaridina rubra]|uniref:Cadherin domain-containing protein n=1 Tax=Halocaridina rubra TaxID=373956 RepID=A0AAN8XI95_HALRR
MKLLQLTDVLGRLDNGRLHLGNAELFFDIDPETGMVTIVREIDRERDTTFFILEITAQEYFENGTIAPSPSNSSTLTNLNIADDNDNTPSFSKSTYEIEMNEVADFDVSMPFDIFVFDMDLGDNGTYTIESDYPDDIRIVPAEAFGNVTLQLTALSSGTIFDYEATQEVTVTLTTTEKADPSHISTATLIVTLNDDNDHVPQFQQSVYTVQVEENVQKGHSLVNISATDDDLSDNFGNASLR